MDSPEKVSAPAAYFHTFRQELISNPFSALPAVALNRMRQLVPHLDSGGALPPAFLSDPYSAPAEVRGTLIAIQALLPPEHWQTLSPAVRALTKFPSLADWHSDMTQRLDAAVALFETDFIGAVRGFRDAPDTSLLRAEFDTQAAHFVRDWSRRGLSPELDDDQARAVAMTSGDVQVIARAGSGKTRVIVARAVFLVTHCHVPPSQLLLLAFNRDAADQMKTALGKWLTGVLPHVMTFHALAHALVHPREELVLDEGAHHRTMSQLVQGLVDTLVASEGNAALIRDLMLSHFREDWETLMTKGSAVRMEEYLAHRRSLPRKTLGGDYVKSFGEKLMANTLFEHGVAYSYESPFRWSGTNYRPDFMIGSHELGGVIIEYFGLTGDADYDEMSEKKRRFWRDPERAGKWKFLEYSPAGIDCGAPEEFTSRLVRDLQSAGVHAKRLDEEEVWERIKKDAVSQFARAMVQFISRCRKLGLSEVDLAQRLPTHACVGRAEQLFLRVGCVLYASYLEELARAGRDDFDGLMWRAVAAIHSGTTTFVRDSERERGNVAAMRFLMVDEFQDFSLTFSRLLEAIRARNPHADYFCVGDDWQAVNGFAGSDLEYFVTFEQRFRNASRLYVSTNWRSDEAIVRAGNSLMRGLGSPARVRDCAGHGACSIALLDEYEPTLIEESLHADDTRTPAILRIVADLLKRGMDVVLLSRRRDDALETDVRVRTSLLDRVRMHLPEGDARRVTSSTAHSYKGLQSQAVVIVDANSDSYPLIHPNWLFLRLFGNSVERIVEEERRLFYVALTRAENAVVFLSDSPLRSPFLANIDADAVNWDKLPPVRPLVLPEQVEIRVYRGFDQKDALKNQNYSWAESRKCWRKLVPREGFDFQRDILSQAWTGDPRLLIKVLSHDGESIHSWPASERTSATRRSPS